MHMRIGGENKMKFLKTLSIFCLALGLAGCFPGEKKIFEDQKVEASTTRASEISVALADAVQNELTLYFMEQNGDNTDSIDVGGTQGIVRTDRCDTGVFAYIHSDNADIRGLDGLDKGSGMQMVRALQERFGKSNVGYKTAQEGISGLENMQDDTACMAEITNVAAAIGSPVVALSFANMAFAPSQEFIDKISQSVHNCSELNSPEPLIGSIRKECSTSYSFNEDGEIQLDQDGFPLVTQDCEQVTDDDIAQFCQVASVAADKNFQISEGITVGTDWSAFFQDPSNNAEITVKCFSIDGEDGENDQTCEPFDPQVNESIVVRCDDEAVPVQQIINPTIVNGLPVTETDGSGEIVPRDCGAGWTGEMIAEYKTRLCTVYDVDSEGNETLSDIAPRQTVYKIYYVGAKCEKEVDNRPIICPIGNGSLYVRQHLEMTNPLALQPYGMERGEETSSSTIAVAGSTTPDVDNRVANEGYILSQVDLNSLDDEAEFSDALVEQMEGFLLPENTACNLLGQSCEKAVLPPVTMVVVDRSGSMGFTGNDQLVRKVVGDRRCRTTLVNVFTSPNTSCPILDQNSYSPGYSASEYDALVAGLKVEFQNEPTILNALSDALMTGGTCEDIYDDTLGDPYFEGRICQQGSTASNCQEKCPGRCEYSVQETGDSQLKYEAVDFAINNVLIPELQYGSSFLYSYFLNGEKPTRSYTVPRCKVIDDPSTTLDNSLPFCDDESTLNDHILAAIAMIADLNGQVQGGTPLLRTLEDALGELEAKVVQRALEYQALTGQTVNPYEEEIAFYVMTDGEDTTGGASFGNVCGPSTSNGSFSSRFKALFPNGELFVLNLPGAVNGCANQLITDPDNPGTKTVDRYFEFNLAGDSFADVFGSIDSTGPVDPALICAQLQLGTYEDDSVADNEGGEEQNVGYCSVATWWTTPPQTCTGYNGLQYPVGHPNCGPFCFDTNGSPWPAGHPNCVDTGGNDDICYDENGYSYPAGHPNCVCDGNTGPTEIENIDEVQEPCDEVLDPGFD